MVKRETVVDSIAIGKLAGSRARKPQPLLLPFSQLANHLVVTGGSASLRMQIALELIAQLDVLKIPFILLETKGHKYRSLLNDRRGMALHTVGNLAIAPLALNPFELLPEVNVKAHAARTAIMFQEIFGLSDQSTAVLHRSIALAYERCGWNLLEAHYNQRCDGSSQTRVHAPELIPSFSDVLEFVDQAIADAQTGANAVDETRNRLVRSLQRYCYGNEKLAFAHSSGASLGTLMESNRVIELAELADPRDLLLSIGTVLNLAAERALPNDGRHVIIIDDAQSLLEAAQATPFSESGGGDWLRQCLSLLTDNSRAVCFLTHGRSFKRADRGIGGCKLLLAEDTAPVRPVLSAIKDEDDRRGGSGKAVFHCIDWDGPVRLHLEERQIEARIPQDKEVAQHWQDSGRPNSPLLAFGETYFPGSFQPKALLWGERVASDSRYYRTFVSYLQAITDDLTQVVHFRKFLVDEVQRVVGNVQGMISNINWCAFSLATDRYFAEKARYHHWSLEQERKIRRDWYEMAAVAFIPSPVTRKLDIKVITMWREEFRALQRRNVGPFAGCLRCKSPCVFGYDAKELLDSATLAEFNRSVSQRFGRASETIVWFAKVLSERLILSCNLDLAYCLAAHMVNEQNLSTHAQEVLMDRVSRLLFTPVEEQAPADAVDSEQAKSS